MCERFLNVQVNKVLNRATSRENLSLGFVTRFDSNQPAGFQKRASFEISCMDAQADLHLCCLHIWHKTGSLMMWLKYTCLSRFSYQL